MKYFARIEDGVVRERIDADALPPFHPDVARQFREVSADVEQGWIVAGDAVVPRPEITPTPQQEYATMLAGGLAITSRANSALNGTYPLDKVAQDRMLGILGALASGFGLPNGAPFVFWPEVDGTPHQFDVDEIKALGKAMYDFSASVEQTLGLKLAGQPAEWPTQPVAIDQP